MENISPTMRIGASMADDRGIKFKSLFIEMDLAIHQSSSNSPRRMQWLPKPSEPHEEFEFTMSHMPTRDQEMFNQTTEASCADKLFFKGQILPLQLHDPIKSQQAMHLPKACPNIERVYSEKGSSSFRHNRDPFVSLQATTNDRSSLAMLEYGLGKPDPGKGLLTMCGNIEHIGTFPVHHFPYQGGLSDSSGAKHVDEEGSASTEFSWRDGLDLMRSCRLDGTFNLFHNDSCSSSFRSHQSNGTYKCNSAEKDSSRDSTASSSRCSDGSYQDSACIGGFEKKAPQRMAMQTNRLGTVCTGAADPSEICDIMSEFQRSENPRDRYMSQNHAQPSVSSSSLRRWSWKSLLTVLKRTSKPSGERIDIDGRVGLERQSNGGAAKGELRDLRKRAIFTFKELPDVWSEPTSSYRRSVGHDREWRQANSSDHFVSREGSLKRGGQLRARWWDGLGMRDEDCNVNDDGSGAIYCLRSGGRQEGSASGCSDEAMEATAKSRGPQGKVGLQQGNRTPWNAKESWNRCMSKMKKGSTKLSAGACKLVSPSKALDHESCINKSATCVSSTMAGASEGEGGSGRKDAGGVCRVTKARSGSSTPVAKSPARRTEVMQSSLNGGRAMASGGTGVAAGLSVAASSVSSSMKIRNNGSCRKVGFSSCPASMRSSPHHSGLLSNSVVTPDLHTAIQGAIAHCKQSQSAPLAAASATPISIDPSPQTPPCP